VRGEEEEGAWANNALGTLGREYIGYLLYFLFPRNCNYAYVCKSRKDM
jgi:hypothetical protein